MLKSAKFCYSVIRSSLRDMLKSDHPAMEIGFNYDGPCCLRFVRMKDGFKVKCYVRYADRWQLKLICDSACKRPIAKYAASLFYAIQSVEGR